MKVILNLLFLYSIIYRVRSDAIVGCLKQTGGDCDLCDHLNFYYLDGTTCTKATVGAECAGIDFDGNCLVCIGQKFPNGATCNDLTPEEEIHLCEGYGADKSC
ncbi:MAG: hypothetical protein DHS20C13_28460 [Thermodesulfobacteriota bacterium]|nr:MAG: hypothetical protein DHS20C13_28460 [Thermodesulfobacteriota bacterium]